MQKRFFTFILLVGFSLMAACPGPGPGPVIGGSLINCLGSNRPQIDSILNELAPLLTTGRPDWSAIYQRAKSAGTSIGGCVIAELVQSYLGGTRAPEVADGWNAHEALEKFRREEAGGATFKTTCVRQDGTKQACEL
jgi:hypothetical protein